MAHHTHVNFILCHGVHSELHGSSTLTYPCLSAWFCKNLLLQASLALWPSHLSDQFPSVVNRRIQKISWKPASLIDSMADHQPPCETHHSWPLLLLKPVLPHLVWVRGRGTQTWPLLLVLAQEPSFKWLRTLPSIPHHFPEPLLLLPAYQHLPLVCRLCCSRHGFVAPHSFFPAGCRGALCTLHLASLAAPGLYFTHSLWFPSVK